MLTVAAGWFLWRGRERVVVVCAGIGGLLIIVALLRPRWLSGPATIWFWLSHVLGRLNTRILLSGFFFVVLTPVGLLMRLGGRDSLRRRRPGAASGWSPYPARQRDRRHYEKMY